MNSDAGLGVRRKASSVCGIAGILNGSDEPVSPAILRRMTEAVAHRGPDGEGSFIDGPVGLGHRRLAVIDLTPAAHQPMVTRDGRYAIAYNGEVYNFQELRLELESRGHQFHSRTDSEVVLYAFAEWGADALGRFNGMFAFAVWDKRDRELTLARDRYGIKPIYYAAFGKTFLFGSEIKALLVHPACPRAMDTEALLEYFTFQNLFTDRTLFKEVRMLPAGTVLRVRPGRGEVPQITRWWDFEFSDPADARDEREYLEELDRLFRTEHYEMVLKAGDMERVMPHLAWHIEEPRVGQSYPNYYAAQLAAKFVTVVLSGAAGDELFGGYPWRYYRAVVNDDFDHYIDQYYLFWQRLIPNREIRRVFRPIWPEVKDVWTRDIFRDVFVRSATDLARPEDYVNHSLYFEAKTFLHGLLVVEDKLSMAHGLETRVPFLDNDLVDFAMKVPVSMKLGNLGEAVRINENEPGKERTHFRRTHDGKLILRKLMARYVPTEIVEGPKQGFSGPDASWFQGESIDYVRRLLYKPNVRIYDYFDRQAVQELVDEHLEGKENRRLLIWSLLSFEQWCRQFLP